MGIDLSLDNNLMMLLLSCVVLFFIGQYVQVQAKTPKEDILVFHEPSFVSSVYFLPAAKIKYGLGAVLTLCNSSASFYSSVTSPGRWRNLEFA
jgi:hypothetical protein